MIDTIKVQIPLSKRQWNKLVDLAFASDHEQWALFMPSRGELYIRRIRGLAETDQHSYHRELMWDVPQLWSEVGTYLTVEFSLPKFWYGHNVSLLNDWLPALKHLRNLLQKQFNLGRSRLSKVEDWKVRRADFCYAWRLPNQETADALMEALKRLRYPWKKPRHYKGSAFWPGSTYSVKIYDKAQEFRAHDLKAMVKGGASLEWVNAIEERAKGVIRFEMTCRAKFLKRQGIETVHDLLLADIQKSRLELSSELKLWYDNLPDSVQNPETLRRIIGMAVLQGSYDRRDDETVSFKWDTPYMLKPLTLDGFGDLGHFPGGGVTFKKVPRPIGLMQEYLYKLVGEGDMSLADRVREKLRTKYSDRKAGRLMGTWLYVQKFGADEAKQLLGRDAFYQDLRAMKGAGVTLFESTDQLIKVDPSFFSSFKLEIPSHAVVNQWDDFRDGDNLLNLADWQQCDRDEA